MLKWALKEKKKGTKLSNRKISLTLQFSGDSVVQVRSFLSIRLLTLAIDRY